MTVRYDVLPYGPAKIQLLSRDAVMRPGGFWHVRNEREFAAALVKNRAAILRVCSEAQISPIVRNHLLYLLSRVDSGKTIRVDDAAQAINYLNSMAFRAGGSSTVKRTTWRVGDFEDGIRVEPYFGRHLQELKHYALSPVRLSIGRALYRAMRHSAAIATEAAANAMDSAARNSPIAASIDDIRSNALPDLLKSRGGSLKSMTKVDFKVALDEKRRARAALIDINAGIIASRLYDAQLEATGCSSGVVKNFAESLLFVHYCQAKTMPRRILISVKDANLFSTYRKEIEALRSALEATARRVHGERVSVGVALANDLSRALRQHRTSAVSVKLADKGRLESPELVIRYGRFDSPTEDFELVSRSINVVDKAHYSLMSDKTLNSRIMDRIRSQLRQVIVPRRIASPDSMFNIDSNEEIERAANIARKEGWLGVVVKLPVKINIGGQDVVNAYFFNPNSPLQIQAVKHAIEHLKSKGHRSLAEQKQERAVLSFEELVSGPLPSLESHAVELRTLVFPNRSLHSSWKRLIGPETLQDANGNHPDS